MKLAIYGAGGLAKEVYIIAQKINKESHRWDEFIFIDDINDISELRGCKVYRFCDFLKIESKETVEFIIGVGEPTIRELLYNKVKENDFKVTTLIHPGVYIDDTTKINEGVVICEGVTITCDIIIGSNSYIHPHVVVGHGIHIGMHTVIGSNSQIGGDNIIGDRVFMGFLSGSREKITIGNDVIVSAGGIVFKNLPDAVIAVGNPARIMKINDSKRVFK